MGDVGCLSIFVPDSGRDHRMLADHLTAEYRIRVEARSRVVDEWKLRANRPDNHLFDCLCGCAVAAAMAGISIGEVGGIVGGSAGRGDQVARTKKTVIKLSELQQQKRNKP
jgi:hypothetical protein